MKEQTNNEKEPINISEHTGLTGKIAKIVINAVGNPAYIESIESREQNPGVGRSAYSYPEPKTFTKRPKR